MHDIQSANKWAIQLLKDHSVQDAQRSAHILLKNTLNVQDAFLISHPEHPLTAKQWRRFKSWVGQRSLHKPIAYILGVKEFYGLDFAVTKDVLIPRPETEMLIELALKYSGQGSCLDVGTGSGIIGICVKKNAPQLIVTALDISSKALEVARGNAEKHNVEILFLESDLFENVEGKFDLIVSNLPYIASDQISLLAKDVCAFEPKQALDGGKQGLDILERFIEGLDKHLSPSGKVLMEIGFDQGQAMLLRMQQKGYININIHKDYQGLDRIVEAQKA